VTLEHLANDGWPPLNTHRSCQEPPDRGHGLNGPFSTSRYFLISMSNLKLVAKLKSPKAWNLWKANSPGILYDLSDADLIGADLCNANLSETNLGRANLKGANLSGADLKGANLSGADLSYTNLRGANLTGTDLRRAKLTEANLGGVNLSRASLRHADLRRVNFQGVDLGEADFTRAYLGENIFADVELSKARGLDTCVHEGPSSLGIESILLSRGDIPEAFLRGCGVPEQLVAYARALLISHREL
jgi:uncharacterized protein YjbI with pentapeptide repeats